MRRLAHNQQNRRKRIKNDKKKKFLTPEQAYGVFITDDAGIVVRVFDAKRSARNWLAKHRPELDDAAKSKLVRTFRSYRQVSDFFEEQIRLGCSDPEVLALMTYYCGCSTKRGFDLGNGHLLKPGEKPRRRGRIIKARGERKSI